ncbi:MAG: hypothetical protein U0166_12215 [Acidobacteriota bacterium]
MSLGDLNNDGQGDLIGGAGRDPVATSQVKAWRYTGAALVQLPGSFVAFNGATYGVNVGSGHYDY